MKLMPLLLLLAACQSDALAKVYRGRNDVSNSSQNQVVPFVDAFSATFDGCDVPGGCGTEEYTTTPDNAAFECGAHLTLILIYNTTACVDGTTCDDFMVAKGTSVNDSYSMLAEFSVGPSVANRFAVGGLANFYQVAALNHIGRWSINVGTYDGTQTGNDARLDLFSVECAAGAFPTCGALTDQTGGAFNGTIPATISDQATAFITGGHPAQRYNYNGQISEMAVFCDGKISLADANNCLLNGSHKMNDLNNMGAACDAVLSHKAVWYRYGDGDTFPTITNRFATTAGNATMTNMEAGDLAANSL